MSWLSDTTELVPGAWLTSRYEGHGVLAENISSTGLDGPSALFGAVSLPADNGKEIRGRITRWPASELSIEEDGTFTYGGGPDYFEFLVSADGIDSPIDIGFGAGVSRILLGMEPGGSFSGSLALNPVAVAGAFAGGTPPPLGRPAADISNSGWAPSTGTTLYSMLNEPIPAESTYILSTRVGDVCELALSATTFPGSSTQSLKIRGSSSTGNGVLIQLKNTSGAVVRSATQLFTPTDTEYSIALTPGEIAAITSGALSVVLESI